MRLKALQLSIFLLFLCIGITQGQTTFYSQGAGSSFDVSDFSNWNSAPDGTGTSASSFLGSNLTYIIQTGDTGATFADLSASGSSLQLEVESGGVLLGNHNIDLAPSATFKLNDGAYYIHNTTDKSIFDGTEDFDSTSTVEIQNWSGTTMLSGSAHPEWGNLTLNIQGSLSNNFNASISAGSTMLVKGNLSLLGTGGKEFRISSQSNVTLQIEGDLVYTGGLFDFSSNSSSTNRVISLKGALTYSGGTWDNNGTNNITFNFDGTDSTVVSFSSIPNSGFLNDIDWNIASGRVVYLLSDFEIGSGETLNVEGSLNANTYQITGGSGRTFSVDSAGILTTANPNGIERGSNDLFESSTTLNFHPKITIRFNCGCTVDYGNDGPSELSKLQVLNNTELKIDQATVISENVLIGNGSEIDIEGGNTLTVETGLTNNGDITCSTNGSFLSDENAIYNGSGDARMRRTISPSDDTRYTYWSSPLVDEDISDVLSSTNSIDLYYYNESSANWISYSSGTMTPGRGYAGTGTIGSTNQQTKLFDGSEFNNGDINIGVTSSSDGFNLIGNPYPSALDADVFITENTMLDGTIYLWQANSALSGGSYSTNDYAQWNSSGGIAAPSSTGAPSDIPTGYVASGQGFFVNANSAGTVSFTNAQRVAANNDQFFKQEPERKEQLWLQMGINHIAINQTLLSFSENATLERDRKYDGKKLQGNPHLSFYSLLDTLEMGIQGQPFLTYAEARTIPLGFRANDTGNYFIAIDTMHNFQQHDIFLIDHVLQKTTNLKDSIYTFPISNSGVFNDRFVISIQRNTDDFAGSQQNSGSIGLNTSIEEETSIDFNIRQEANSIHITSPKDVEYLFVFDLLGREIITSSEMGSEFTFQIEPEHHGMHIIVLQTETGESMTKKVVF